jgi:hypothetical protein
MQLDITWFMQSSSDHIIANPETAPPSFVQIRRHELNSNLHQAAFIPRSLAQEFH